MNRLILTLLLSPGIVASLLLNAHAVRASESHRTQRPVVLDLSITKQMPASIEADHPMLEFTEEESNTAIALFGCDCPAHLNRLRSLRGQPPVQEDLREAWYAEQDGPSS